MVLLAFLPSVLGTTWTAVRSVVVAVPVAGMAVLAALWWAGLVVYAQTLTGALPGLTRRRALLLNLSGSALSNVLPAGGVAGMWLNSTMLRRWGFSARHIADFTVTSNLFDVVGKLAVCVSAVVLTAAVGSLPGQVLVPTVAVTVAVALLVGIAVALSSRTGSAAAARVVLRCADVLARIGVGRLGRERTRRRVARARVEVVALRRQVRQTVGGRWRHLSAGVVGYVLLQGVLLGVCLSMTGAAAQTTPSVVVVAFVVDRLASTLPVTPAGVGFAEAGATAVLLAGGVTAGPALAGVLLYRLFVVVLEVPVGSLALAGWWGFRRIRRTTA